MKKIIDIVAAHKTAKQFIRLENKKKAKILVCCYPVLM
jgi:hypothetical protein